MKRTLRGYERTKDNLEAKGFGSISSMGKHGGQGGETLVQSDQDRAGTFCLSKAYHFCSQIKLLRLPASLVSKTFWSGWCRDAPFPRQATADPRSTHLRAFCAPPKTPPFCTPVSVLLYSNTMWTKTPTRSAALVALLLSALNAVSARQDDNPPSSVIKDDTGGFQAVTCIDLQSFSFACAGKTYIDVSRVDFVTGLDVCAPAEDEEGGGDDDEDSGESEERRRRLFQRRHFARGLYKRQACSVPDDADAMAEVDSKVRLACQAKTKCEAELPMLIADAESCQGAQGVGIRISSSISFVKHLINCVISIDTGTRRLLQVLEKEAQGLRQACHKKAQEKGHKEDKAQAGRQRSRHQTSHKRRQIRQRQNRRTAACSGPATS